MKINEEAPRSRPCTNWSGRCMYGFGEIEPKVWVPSLKTALSFITLATRNKKGAVVLLGFQAFQRGFIRRNRPRDDEARLKSLEEKPSVPAGGASVPAGGVNWSLYAAVELSSSFSVLGNLLRLVWNKSSCSPRSFSAPSSEDLAWISNQVDPTRFFMIFHADHTCSWESRWSRIKSGIRSEVKSEDERRYSDIWSLVFVPWGVCYKCGGSAWLYPNKVKWK